MRKVFFVLLMASASISLVSISHTPVYAGGGNGGGGNSGGGGSNGNKPQKLPASQVPAPVMSSFLTGFPDAQQTEWEKTPLVYYGPTIYTANFKQNGQSWQASYYADGTLVSASPSRS